MTQRPPGEIERLLGRQAGVITRAQALAGGMSRHAVQAKLDTGRWQRLHFGVYAAYSGRPARESVMWAAVLGARTGAVLCHQTAAELYGLLEAGEGRAVHVMVASGSAVAPMKGVVVHYSQRVDVARHPALEPPRTRLEETVLDLAAAEATATRATGWILNACASLRTTPDRLLAALKSQPRIPRRAMLLAALGDARAGVGSVLEHGYLHRVERPHGLPTGVRQRRVRTGRVWRYEDVRYEEYGVIVELDGRAAHPEGERWRDIRRDNVSAANGLITLATPTPTSWTVRVRSLTRSPAPSAAAATPAARRCGPSCAPGDPTVLAGAARRPGRACG